MMSAAENGIQERPENGAAMSKPTHTTDRILDKLDDISDDISELKANLARCDQRLTGLEDSSKEIKDAMKEEENAGGIRLGVKETIILFIIIMSVAAGSHLDFGSILKWVVGG